MNIPQIRRELKEQAAKVAALAVHYADLELLDVARKLVIYEIELYRRGPVKRALPTARRMTPALKAEIREFAQSHPDMLNRDIGAHFEVDGGRVTDALLGRRQ